MLTSISMLIVGVFAAEVEEMLHSGFGPGLSSAMTCPACDGALSSWGGYRRRVRTGGIVVVLLIARVRCRVCGVTHALLPDFLLARRRDIASHVVFALEGAAGGRGWRPLCAALGVPGATVRGWLRRLRHQAPARAALFWRLSGALGEDAPRAPPALSLLGGLWQAMTLAHRAASRAIGVAQVGAVCAFSSRVTGGGLLFNTPRP